MTRTRVRVIGASAAAIRQLRAIAPARLDVVDEPLAEIDWMLVATGGQRSEAIRSSGLPPFRVLEMPAIAGDLDRPDTDALRAVLVKIRGHRRVASRDIATRHTPRRGDRSTADGMSVSMRS